MYYQNDVSQERAGVSEKNVKIRTKWIRNRLINIYESSLGAQEQNCQLERQDIFPALLTNFCEF